ncbi:MAG: recombinase family protein [Candidatus Gottesmanbacteria bacterium]|nr:recombinase family protein [Candidatus Gottesmanbacteria bacterium]
MKNCVTYVRVSSDKQIDGYSLDSQQDLCQKKADQLGFIVAKTFREEGVSASTTDRAQLQEMLTFVKDPKNDISAIIVYAFSRLNRNTLDYLVIRELMAKHGVSLISTTEPSGDRPAEKMIETILASFNQYQNEERAQNVSNSLKRRFTEGHITSKPPIGYLMQKVNGKSIAVKDPTWFPVIQTMWHRVDQEKLSMIQVAREINKLGLTLTHDSRCKKFLRQSASRVFSNKFYAGILVSQKYGEATGQQEAMIDLDTFYRVREILTGKRPSKLERYAKQREDFPLRGILRCECGKKLSSAWSKGKYKKYGYYACPTRGVHKVISYGKDGENGIEEAFLKLVDGITFDEGYMQWFGEMVLEKWQAQNNLLIHTEDQVHRDIAELEELLRTVRLKNAKGVYTDKEYLAMKDDLETQLAVKRGIVSEKKIDRLDVDTSVNFIKYYFSHMKRVWIDASLEGKLAIGCSMFPNGLVYEGIKFRTPELGRGYAMTREYSTPSAKVGESAEIRTQNQ